MKTLTFRGGVHPPGNKHFSADKPVETLPLPDTVYIPLSQHTGAPAEALVKAGDIVRAGQKIGEAKGFVSAPVHASVSGKVSAVASHPHPVLGVAEAVVIKRDGDEWIAAERRSSFSGMEPARLKEIIRDSGIAGMGGACFPTAVKLSPPEHAKIGTLLINGAECEPYITADHRLMLESGAEIAAGAEILMHILGVKECFIAIEDNKPLCIKSMEQAVSGKKGIRVVSLAAKYPQGGEKQLIKAILKRSVPSGGLPLDVGVIVQNVATARAVKEAVMDGRPLVARVVTVSGEGINQPKNLLVRLGTPFRNLLEHCGGFSGTPGKVIAGGPMMGIAQYSIDTPVLKGTSGLLVFPRSKAAGKRVFDCIRCGSCVDACPVSLVPSELARYSRKEMWAHARDSGLNDCMECGSCSYVCPAGIPIVHFIKDAKAKCRNL